MTTLGAEFRPPPRLETDKGETRRIGVELEFAAVSAARGAELVHELFGGRVQREDAHRFHVKETELGDFVVELDSRLAHRSKATQPSKHAFDRFLDELGEEMRRIYGDVSSVLVPCEIVCPPIPMTDLPRVDALVEALRHAGATGTGESPLHAFGAQLNPEIATEDPDWLVRMLKAYMLMSDWLRAVTDMDPTRRIAAFADPFPEAYMRRVVYPGYRPSLDTLIGDYLDANDTRNRELDLLPLFAWLDEKRVRGRLPNEKISKRPTFHYRLPNADLGRLDWNVSVEWNRWRVVERLAEKPKVLDAMGRAWLNNDDRTFPADWGILSTEWLLLE